MTLTLDEMVDLLDGKRLLEDELIKSREQVVQLTNAIKCILWHPRSGETLRKASELVAKIEANP